MTYNEDMLGALFMVACLYAVKSVEESNGYYIVAFEGTTSTITIDGSQVTREQIDETIREATSD